MIPDDIMILRPYEGWYEDTKTTHAPPTPDTLVHLMIMLMDGFDESGKSSWHYDNVPFKDVSARLSTHYKTTDVFEMGPGWGWGVYEEYDVCITVSPMPSEYAEYLAFNTDEIYARNEADDY